MRPLKDFLTKILAVDKDVEQCRYCGRYFATEDTLELHQNGQCEEKRIAEDLYYFPEKTEKGIIEVEGWEIRYVNEEQNGKIICEFCGTKISLPKHQDAVIVEEGNGAYHRKCAKERQRLQGDRE